MAKKKVYTSQYTPKQRQDYNAQMSRKGSCFVNRKTGEVILNSDFARGRYFEKARQICKARKKCAKKHEGKVGNELMVL